MCDALCDGGNRCEDHRALRTTPVTQLIPATVDGAPDLDWIDDPACTPEALYQHFDKRVAAATILRMRAAADHEPQITTTLMAAAASSQAHLVGLAFRVKAPVSVARKIHTKRIKRPLLDYGQIAASLNDVVRYTVTLDDDPVTMVRTVEAVASKLTDDGWELLELEHSHLEGNPYRGIHAIFRHTTGETTEIQFHTASGLDAKEASHPHYEAYRNPDLPLPERTAAYAASVTAWSTIPIPQGIDALTIDNHPVTLKDYRRNEGPPS